MRRRSRHRRCRVLRDAVGAVGVLVRRLVFLALHDLSVSCPVALSSWWIRRRQRGCAPLRWVPLAVVGAADADGHLGLRLRARIGRKLELGPERGKVDGVARDGHLGETLPQRRDPVLAGAIERHREVRPVAADARHHRRQDASRPDLDERPGPPRRTSPRPCRRTARGGRSTRQVADASQPARRRKRRRLRSRRRGWSGAGRRRPPGTARRARPKAPRPASGTRRRRAGAGPSSPAAAKRFSASSMAAMVPETTTCCGIVMVGDDRIASP